MPAARTPGTPSSCRGARPSRWWSRRAGTRCGHGGSKEEERTRRGVARGALRLVKETAPVWAGRGCWGIRPKPSGAWRPALWGAGGGWFGGRVGGGHGPLDGGVRWRRRLAASPLPGAGARATACLRSSLQQLGQGARVVEGGVGGSTPLRQGGGLIVRPTLLRRLHQLGHGKPRPESCPVPRSLAPAGRCPRRRRRRDLLGEEACSLSQPMNESRDRCSLAGRHRLDRRQDPCDVGRHGLSVGPRRRLGRNGSSHGFRARERGHQFERLVRLVIVWNPCPQFDDDRCEAHVARVAEADLVFVANLPRVAQQAHQDRADRLGEPNRSSEGS
ncbi:hypothetical protein SCYAM73S_08194 [Streptomyces cyaneofuscatus]